MNYYLDTEFHEYHKQHKVCGIKIGKAIPTIDLISIGIVSEDNREYYAISKDFNLKDAWNSWQLKILWHDDIGLETKEYWLRENVLKPIFKELIQKDIDYYKIMYRRINTWTSQANSKHHVFNYKNFKRLINKYGKTNKQIAEEIKEFTKPKPTGRTLLSYPPKVEYDKSPINFYAYYADYDWVVFCQLFDKMIGLPNVFPMYCRDLKQILDDRTVEYFSRENAKHYLNDPIEEKLRLIKNFVNYPKQDNEHNALDDAKWNKKLHEFLNTL